MTDIKEIFSYLVSKDEKLKKILELKSFCPILAEPKLSNNFLFTQIARSIVGQQLSNIVAKRIWERMTKDAKSPRAFVDKFKSIKLSEAKKFGLSLQKLSYIKEIAKNIHNRKISLSRLAKLEDNEVREKITELKGVGEWTADMFLIFSLKRKDIFSSKDSGLRRAISLLYKIDKANEKKFLSITSKWSPYRSIVCWYLWKALDRRGKELS